MRQGRQAEEFFSVYCSAWKETGGGQGGEDLARKYQMKEVGTEVIK